MAKQIATGFVPRAQASFTPGQVRALLTDFRVNLIQQRTDSLNAEKQRLRNLKLAYQQIKNRMSFQARARREAMHAKTEAAIAAEEAVDTSNYIFVMYPELAEQFVPNPQWAAILATRIEGKFTQLPGQHAGHDVYVYWSYDQWEVNAAWIWSPPSILNNEGLMPWDPSKSQGHPATPVIP